MKMTHYHIIDYIELRSPCTNYNRRCFVTPIWYTLISIYLLGSIHLQSISYQWNNHWKRKGKIKFGYLLSTGTFRLVAVTGRQILIIIIINIQHNVCVVCNVYFHVFINFLFPYGIGDGYRSVNTVMILITFIMNGHQASFI